MSALSHVLLTQTPASNGAPAGQTGTPGRTPFANTSGQGGGHSGHAFAAMISAQNPLQQVSPDGPPSGPLGGFTGFDFDFNGRGTKAATFPIEDPAGHVALTPVALDKIGRPIIAETPVIAGISAIEPQGYSGQISGVNPDITTKIDRAIIAETPAIAGIVSIEPDAAITAKTAPTIIAETPGIAGISAIEAGAAKTTAPIIAETPTIAGIATIETGAAKTAAPIIAETPFIAGIASIEPDAATPTKITPTIIAETPGIAGISVIESGAVKTTAPIIAETPDLAGIESVEPGSTIKAKIAPTVIAETPEIARIDSIEGGATKTAAPIIAETPTLAGIAAIEPDMAVAIKAAPTIIAETPERAGVSAIEPTLTRQTGQADRVTPDILDALRLTPIADLRVSPGMTVTASASSAPNAVQSAQAPLPGVDAGGTILQPVSAAPQVNAAAVTADPSATLMTPSSDPVLNAVTATPASTPTGDIDPIATTAVAAEPTDTRSSRSAHAAEFRVGTQQTAKLAATIAAPATDAPKMSDLPSNSAQISMNAETAPVKTLPVAASTPTLVPVSGLGERMAATILQATNAPTTTVTLDKIPQAVVAVALSAKSATLQIDPPELGRIQLDYQFDVQGRTVVTLTPESEAARAALMERMAVITAALEQGSNSPIDVELGDARDFGAAFGQASQDADRSNGEAGSESGSAHSAQDTVQASAVQQFSRTPAGEQDRLHILV